MNNKKTPVAYVDPKDVRHTSEIFLKKLEDAKSPEEEFSLKEECRDQLDHLIIHRTTGPALNV